MPDNAVYYHIAYGAASFIYIAYAIRLSVKRSKVRSQRSQAEGR